jgi:hypothetical protein
MTLIRFKRVQRRRDEPIVTIHDGRFYFNAPFAKLAELRGKRAVVYSVDDERQEIGFEFLAAKEDDDAYTLEQRHRGSIVTCRCSALELIKTKDWIRSVARQSSNDLRSFKATRFGKPWIIRLRPSFEVAVSREKRASIPFKARGIYRYRDSHNQIVYIGKGAIRPRLGLPERAHWTFTWIDYSVVATEEDQFAWEAFWLDRHREENNGRLPYYNRQRGSS